MRKKSYLTRRGKPQSQMSQLRAVVRVCIDQMAKRGKNIKVQPTWVAEAAMRRLDKKRRTPDLVAFSSSLELRQIARAELRSNFEPETPEEIEQAPQHPLLENMRAMYPLKPKSKDHEPTYVSPDHEEFGEEDMLWNYHRDKAAGASVIRSADALYAWWYSPLNPKNHKKQA